MKIKKPKSVIISERRDFRKKKIKIKEKTFREGCRSIIATLTLSGLGSDEQSKIV
jgi:hypothetical protein